MKLLEFVLDNCYFTCNDYYYQQVFGCPIGSPVSELLADLVMEYIDWNTVLLMSPLSGG